MRRAVMAAAGRSHTTKGFVGRRGAQLVLNGTNYSFTGFNAFGIGGGEGTAWTRTQMDSYFAALPVNSMTRTWCFDGYVTTTLLDDLVASAEAHNQKLILTLNNDSTNLVLDGAKTNTWYASGYTGTYSGGSGTWQNWITTVVSRYRHSPAVGMWEIINEAGQSQGADHVLSGTTMLAFYGTVAGWIKALDPYHLISTGDSYEALYVQTSSDGGLAQYQQASSAAGVDVLSLHDYELDFGGTSIISSHWANSVTAASNLGKPVIVGEVGQSACSIDHKIRSATIRNRVDNYLNQGASGALVWNYSQSYYNTCGTGGDDYILVSGDALATEIQNYATPATLASETWTGTTGASWPAQWTTTSNGGAATIQSNAGQLTTPATAYTPGALAYLGSMTAHQTLNLKVTVSWSTVAEAYTYVSLGSDGTNKSGSTLPNNGYCLVVSTAGAYDIQRVVAGTATDLSTNQGITWVANTSYNIRFVIIPSTGFVGVRIWTGTSEPPAWNWAGVDSSPYTTAGRAQLQHASGAASTSMAVTFDNLTITNAV